MSDRILSVEAVANRLGVSSRTVDRMAAAGILPNAVKISLNRRGWPASEIDAYIEARKAERDGVLVA